MGHAGGQRREEPVTLARSASDTFAGIRPVDVAPFICAQLLGAAAATALFRWLVPALPQVADEVVVPHGPPADRRPPRAAATPGD